MRIIKRTKGGRTHYALSLAPAGNVTGLTPRRADALPVTDAQAETVRAFYADREAAGLFTFEVIDPATPAPVAEAKAVEPTPVPEVVEEAKAVEPEPPAEGPTPAPAPAVEPKPPHHGKGKRHH